MRRGLEVQLQSLDTLAVFATLAACGLTLLVLLRGRRRRDRLPPMATGSMPIIGHALAYKHDPAAFVTVQCETIGPCFRVNLAGKKMVIIGRSSEAMRQVALAPESVLSARQAVLDIGFEETLGVLNVTVGTDMHKRILKANYAPSGLEKEVPQLYASLGIAITRRLAATEPAFAVDASSSAPLPTRQYSSHSCCALGS